MKALGIGLVGIVLLSSACAKRISEPECAAAGGVVMLAKEGCGEGKSPIAGIEWTHDGLLARSNPGICCPRPSSEPKRRELSLAEINVADGLALPYIYGVLSDDILALRKLKRAPSTLAEAKKVGLPVWIKGPIPSNFTIGGIPFSRYKRKYERGWELRDVRIVTVQYFDPVAIPNWDQLAGVDGGFPSYFSVTIDMVQRKIVAHGAYK